MSHEPLLQEMIRALRAEFGARAMYRQLPRVCGDAALRDLLAQFAADEEEQVRELRAVIARLGGDPPRRSLRRWVLATVLAWGCAVIGVRPALRLCEEAEGTAARWYARFERALAALGEPAAAEALARLGVVKRRHERVLRTWVAHSGRR